MNDEKIIELIRKMDKEMEKRFNVIVCEVKELKEEIKILKYDITKSGNRLDTMLKSKVISHQFHKDLEKNYDKNMSADELLNIIANGMGTKVTTWNTVKEATEKNISFAMILDSSKYLTEDEIKRIEEKSNIF